MIFISVVGVWLYYVHLAGDYTDGAFVKAYWPWLAVQITALCAWSWMEMNR
jgi:hypothetical protein